MSTTYQTKERRTHLDRISLSPKTRFERIWVSSVMTSGGTGVEDSIVEKVCRSPAVTEACSSAIVTRARPIWYG
jgi:hypothetical protein